LQKLNIKIIHKVPVQHKIEGTGFRAPSKKKKKLFEKHTSIKEGLYTFEESEIIKKTCS